MSDESKNVIDSGNCLHFVKAFDPVRASELAAPIGSADDRAARLMRFIDRMHNEGATANGLTNMQLADALISKVWSKMDMDSEESALVAAAIDRLQGVTVNPAANPP